VKETMKKYDFLLKPLFFIINLVFATWLVLAIERAHPSDFGSFGSIFNPPERPRKVTHADKAFLRKLIVGYKQGQIDSLLVERQLDSFLAPVKE
jgi:hypothetical protein